MYTINTPFGLYCYVRLYMGVKSLPDTEKLIINKILEETGVEDYIDDYDYWSNNSFDSHLMEVDKILRNLEKMV